MGVLFRGPVAAVASVSIAVIALLAPLDVGGPLVVFWTLICAAATFRAATRMNEHRGIVVAISGLIFLIGSGNLLRGLLDPSGDSIGSSFSIADILQIPAYAGFAVIAWKILKKRTLRRDLDAWLDAIAMALAIFLILWVAFFGDFFFGSGLTLAAFSINATYNILSLIALSIVLRITATPGPRPTAYRLLGIGYVCGFVADLSSAISIAEGTGVRVAIALSPIAFGLFASGMSHESASEIFRPHVETEESVGLWRVLIVFAASAAPLAFVVDSSEHNAAFKAVALAVGIGLATMVFTRVFRLLRRQQSAGRRDRELASHLAAIAGLDRGDIRKRLPLIANSLVAGATVRIDSYECAAETTLTYALGPLLRDSPGECLIVDIHDQQEPQVDRLLQTLVRDAEHIAQAAEVTAEAARQASAAEANERIATKERRFRSLVQNASDIIAVVDDVGRVTYISDAVFTVLGYVPDDVIGEDARSFIHRNDIESAIKAFGVVFAESGQRRDEFRGQHADGSTRLFDVTLTDMRSVPEVDGFVLNLSDVTDQRRLEQDLKSAETTDSLTLQLNRSAFIGELEVALRRTDVSGVPLCVVIVDLNDFKTVNDALGPVLADSALVECADRIRRSVRINDIVARLSGDEFGILMPDGYTSVEALASAERVLQSISEPFVLEGRTVPLSATAGIAINSGEDVQALELLRRADTALSIAKMHSPGGAMIFEAEMGRKVTERLELRRAFSTAIEKGEMRLVYQPIVSVETGEILSLEALARWTHPTLGVIPPSTFIPIAEESDRIHEVGEWALRAACEQIVEWNEIGIDGFTVSVNMSGYQLRDDETIGLVERILSRTGVDPQRLVIEITESVLIDNTDFTRRRIAGLRALGLALAIDDFGTGYSSLSYLQQYEFDILKIDKAFVERLADADNVREREIVRSIISLARGLDAVTVAEGIETEAEFDVLRNLGCDKAQGYLFHRPIEASAVAPTLAAERLTAAGHGAPRSNINAA